MMACAAENEQIHDDKWLGRSAKFCCTLRRQPSAQRRRQCSQHPQWRFCATSVLSHRSRVCVGRAAVRLFVRPVAFARSVGFVASTRTHTILRLLLRVFLVVIQAL